MYEWLSSQHWTDDILRSRALAWSLLRSAWLKRPRIDQNLYYRVVNCIFYFSLHICNDKRNTSLCLNIRLYQRYCPQFFHKWLNVLWGNTNVKIRLGFICMQFDGFATGHGCLEGSWGEWPYETRTDFERVQRVSSCAVAAAGHSEIQIHWGRQRYFYSNGWPEMSLNRSGNDGTTHPSTYSSIIASGINHCIINTKQRRTFERNVLVQWPKYVIQTLLSVELNRVSLVVNRPDPWRMPAPALNVCCCSDLSDKHSTGFRYPPSGLVLLTRALLIVGVLSMRWGRNSMDLHIL